MNLDALLDDEQLFHSTYQLTHFIVGKGGTPYGQYKQAVRELSQRVGALRGLFVRGKQMELRAKKLALAMSENPTCDEDRLKHEELHLEQSQETWNRCSLEQSIKDTYREFTVLFELAASLKEQIGTLTDEVREELEANQWKYNTQFHIAMDMISHGAVSKQTWSLIMSLASEDRAELIQPAGTQPIEYFRNWLLKSRAPKLLESTPPALEDLKNGGAGT